MAGGAHYRALKPSFFDAPVFQKLSPEARLVLITLRLGPQTNAAGIFYCYTEVLVHQTGLAQEAVERALEQLQTASWISRDGLVIWVRNALRDDPLMRLKDEKHLTAVIRAIAGLPDLPIVREFCDCYGLRCPFDDPSKGHRRLLGDPCPPIPTCDTDQDPESERETPPPPDRAASREEPGHRLPEDFALSPEDVQFARSHGISDVPAELEKFRDYHVAQGTVAVDWHARWRLWCARARDFLSQAGNGAIPRKPPLFRASDLPPRPEPTEPAREKFRRADPDFAAKLDRADPRPEASRPETHPADGKEAERRAFEQVRPGEEDL